MPKPSMQWVLHCALFTLKTKPFTKHPTCLRRGLPCEPEAADTHSALGILRVVAKDDAVYAEAIRLCNDVAYDLAGFPLWVVASQDGKDAVRVIFETALDRCQNGISSE